LLILLTNDDGVGSEGLRVLKDKLSERHEVCVVAPERERTCVGHAITLHKPLRIREVSRGIFSTNGTPVDAIYLGVKVLLSRRPDFVISGINKGPNMGQDVTYSGTVAAAKEGAFIGIPSMAVSLCARKDFRFEAAGTVTAEVVEMLAGRKLPEHTFLNINIPNRLREDIDGFVVTRLGKRIYDDSVITRVDPRGEKYYWIGGNGESCELSEGTDFHAIEEGCVSVTPLGLDATSIDSIEGYRRQFEGRR
jgi:5'-nucleotidase